MYYIRDAATYSIGRFETQTLQFSQRLGLAWAELLGETRNQSMCYKQSGINTIFALGDYVRAMRMM
jgi:hypothetical protein